MKTMWLAGAAVGIMTVCGTMSKAQQPVQTRQIERGPGGGGETGVTLQMNRQATRRVQGGPGNEPQIDQQTGQFKIQRQTVNPGLRRMPMRPSARWRLGVDTNNAPKGLLIA